MVLCTLLLGGVESERGAESELLGALDEAAAIAAEHRLNVDDIPEFVTVLHQQWLRDLGVKDLFEALSLVPGIQTSVMQNGIKKVVMRGFNNPDSLTFDKFKLIVDGHIVQTAIFQNSSYYLNFPIELIERIEVILGPAAALETSGALTGIIRITTKSAEREDGSLFMRAGSYGERMGGLRRRFRVSAKGDLTLDLYYRRHDRGLEASDYILEGTSPEISRSSEWLRDYTLGLLYRHEEFTLTARTKRERHGNYFGWEEHLERSAEPSMENRYLYLQGLYESSLGATETMHLQLDFSHYRFDATAQEYLDTPSGKLPYDFALYLSEASWQLGAFVTSSRFERHRLKVGCYTSKTRQIGDRFDIQAPDGSIVATKLTRSGLSRCLTSLYLNDAVALSSHTDAHLGIRYDHLSDMQKGYFSINASLLFRTEESWSVKIGYGHAYRAPSWVELYTYPNPGMRVGNPDLEAEEADMIEGSLIYRPSLESSFKLNIYRSRIRNLLDIYDQPRSLPDAPGYANLPSRFSHGFELEYRFTPAIGQRVATACAYNSTDYTTEYGIEQKMPGVAHWSGYAVYILNLDASSTLSASLHYLGARTANVDTDREDLPPCTTFDMTYGHTFGSGGKLYAGIKNLFDEEVADPSYFGRHDGIVRPGRTWLLSFEYPL